MEVRGASSSLSWKCARFVILPPVASDSQYFSRARWLGRLKVNVNEIRVSGKQHGQVEH